MKASPTKFTYKGARNLVAGDQLISATGRVLTVTLVNDRLTRTIVLFDGDMEVDFDPYCQLKVYPATPKKK